MTGTERNAHRAVFDSGPDSVFSYFTLMKPIARLYRSSRNIFDAIGVGTCGDLSG